MRIILQESKVELDEAFEKIGEPSYGLFMQKVLSPIYGQLSEAGLSLKPGFIVPNSLEHWGPPEEWERCRWCVVRQSDGTPIGTLVLRVFHSHVKFDIPMAPATFFLEETGTDAIIAAIANSVIRLKGRLGGILYQDRESDSHTQSWEYSVETGLSDYLDATSEVEVTTLDYALSRWGKKGWELTSIIPHDNRLIAFFKRPVR